jgi:hypothetical protein
VCSRIIIFDMCRGMGVQGMKTLLVEKEIDVRYSRRGIGKA